MKAVSRMSVRRIGIRARREREKKLQNKER
jgi:hypothetical protein